MLTISLEYLPLRKRKLRCTQLVFRLLLSCPKAYPLASWRSIPPLSGLSSFVFLPALLLFSCPCSGIFDTGNTGICIQWTLFSQSIRPFKVLLTCFFAFYQLCSFSPLCKRRINLCGLCAWKILCILRNCKKIVSNNLNSVFAPIKNNS